MLRATKAPFTTPVVSDRPESGSVIRFPSRQRCRLILLDRREGAFVMVGFVGGRKFSGGFDQLDNAGGKNIQRCFNRHAMPYRGSIHANSEMIRGIGTRLQTWVRKQSLGGCPSQKIDADHSFATKNLKKKRKKEAPEAISKTYHFQGVTPMARLVIPRVFWIRGGGVKKSPHSKPQDQTKQRS